MSIAETAQLAVDLKLGTTGSFAGATSQLGAVEAAAVRGTGATGFLGRGFTAAKSAAASFGGALSHAKGQLVGLLTGPLGMLGLGAGLFSIAGLFKAGIGQARDFGGEVKKLAALTGLSYETTSKLAGAFEHFGVSADSATKIAGLFEKNLFALTDTTRKAGASSDALTKAQERLHVAQLKLHELEGRRHVSQSQMVAAQNRVADATRALAAVHAKEGTTVSNAAAFYHKYGLALVDASGHAKDFNTLLLDAADFWNNKTIPAQTKAAALAKLYGRSWQELIPILGAGRKGISAAEEEAAKFGLTITKDNIDALSRAKEATRTWGDALGGLKLQIGLAVLPTLTDFTKGITSLVVGNRDRIVGFIKGIADGAKQLASAFGSYILPSIQSVASIVGTMFNAAGGVGFASILQESAHFAKDLGNALNSFVVPGIKAIVGAWDSLPGPLRSLLIEGFIANKVIKWTFGFDAAGFGLTLAKTFISNVAGKLTADIGGALAAVGIGKAFVQPVFVTNPGFGLPGALGGAAGAAEGAAAGAGIGVAGVATAAIPLGALALGLTNNLRVLSDLAEENNQLTAQGLTANEIAAQRYYNANAADQQTLFKRWMGVLPSKADFDSGNQKLIHAYGTGGLSLDDRQSLHDSAQRLQDIKDADNSIATGLNKRNQEWITAVHGLKTASKPADVMKAIHSALALIIGGHRGSVSSTADVLRDLKHQLANTHDPKLQSALRSAIGKVEHKLSDRKMVDGLLHKADQIFRSNESGGQKLKDLQALQRELVHRGLPKAAHDLQVRIDRAKAAIAAGAMQTTAAVNRKKLSVTVQNTTVTNVNVNARDVFASQRNTSRVFSTASGASAGK